MSQSKDIVIVFNSDGMGDTSAQDLRETLARKFLQLLPEVTPAPAAICFYTGGVRLVCDESPILKELQALEDRGVRLVICKTCLDYFGLAGSVRVGIVGGMPDIITAMWAADTVITL